jgi:NAD(P)-dependent dehydrogenase (short-subunit alcohol dehydrogenase family)
MSSEDDLIETQRMVEELDRRCLTAAVDVRDYGSLNEQLERGAEELGGLDVVVANAGIASFAPGSIHRGSCMTRSTGGSALRGRPRAYR